MLYHDMNFQEMKRRNYIKSRKKVKEQYCNNCGRYGHPYRKCEEPITSYGIICYKVVQQKIYYILIRRRNSIGFTEFLSGRYRVTMKDYICYLLSHMTQAEQQLLLTKPFDSDVLLEKIRVILERNHSTKNNIDLIIIIILLMTYIIRPWTLNEFIFIFFSYMMNVLINYFSLLRINNSN